MSTEQKIEHRYGAIIVGGGQAGLSMSWYLCRRGIDHVILERHVPGHAWRAERWDSFCLVTPNWQCQLPGFPYAGSDPHGFMLRQEIIDYMDAYIASFNPPVLSGVEALKLCRGPAGEFRLATSAGAFTAEQVVIATGGYHDPIVPCYAERLAPDIVQLHSSEYRNPQSLPAGAVLVVGSGQSGCQIAEDLHLESRPVHLCVGAAPRVARRYRGKDVVEWLHLMGYYDIPVEQHPLKEGRAATAPTTTSPGAMADATSICANGRWKACGFMGGWPVSMTVRCASSRISAPILTRRTPSRKASRRSIDGFIAKHGIAAPPGSVYQPIWTPQRGA